MAEAVSGAIRHRRKIARRHFRRDFENIIKPSFGFLFGGLY